MQNYQPILKALEAGNAAHALKLTQQQQQVTPNLLLLRAVALSRTGKREESLAVAEPLLKECTKFALADVERLQTVFASAQRFDLAARLMHTAYQGQPGSEQFAQQTFFALVRARDYEGQEKHSLDMFKRFKQNATYLIWHVISMLLNMRHTGLPPVDDKTRAIKLMIAERYLESAMKDKVVEWESILNKKSEHSFAECK